MSNTAFSITYSFASIKLRFSEQKRALNLLSLGSLGFSWGSLGALSVSLGAPSGSLGFPRPQGAPDLFFAMIFEHFFCDAQKSLQKTIQDRPRAPRGGLRRRLGPVSDVS